MMQQSWEVSAGEIPNVSEYVRLLTMRKIKEEKQICYYSSWKKKNCFLTCKHVGSRKSWANTSGSGCYWQRQRHFKNPKASGWEGWQSLPQGTDQEQVLNWYWKWPPQSSHSWVFTEWSLLSYRDCSNWDGLNLSSWTSLVVIISCVF